MAAAALVVALSFVYPLVIEPVFNRFSPLEEGELRTSLLRMAEDDGVLVEDVLVADASRRTSTLNAYVSGFGATRRIVVYDTLLDQAPAEQVRTVVAHELGHAAEHDVRNGTLLGALLAAAGCARSVACSAGRGCTPGRAPTVHTTRACWSPSWRSSACSVSSPHRCRPWSAVG